MSGLSSETSTSTPSSSREPSNQIADLKFAVVSPKGFRGKGPSNFGAGTYLELLLRPAVDSRV